MSDRGIKKFNAFKSLKGQDMLIDQIKKDRLKVPRPQLESDEIERLENILSTLEVGQTISIQIYKNGYLEEKTGEITKIKDNIELRVEKMIEVIKFSDIVDMTTL